MKPASLVSLILLAFVNLFTVAAIPYLFNKKTKNHSSIEKQSLLRSTGKESKKVLATFDVTHVGRKLKGAKAPKPKGRKSPKKTKAPKKIKEPKKTNAPTKAPTKSPTAFPTVQPTGSPTTPLPSPSVSDVPSSSPVIQTDPGIENERQFHCPSLDCEKVNLFKINEDGSPRLASIINSVFQENQDSFTSYYCKDDFDIAVNWFLDDSNHSTDGIDNISHYFKERFTLALLYASNCKEGCKLSQPESSAWLTSADHCTWTGVTCENEAITSLSLSMQGLSQHMTMFALNSLEHAYFDSNNICGTFTVVEEMESLEVLSLSNNKLRSIAGMANFPNLMNLILFGNYFLGEFKITDETFPVDSLKLLNLSSNNLSLVNGLKNLTSLEYLYINDNYLEGNFYIDESMKTLKGLELSRNKLTGLEGIQFLNSLEEVDLSRNELAATFVISQHTLPELRGLDLKGNELTNISGLQFLKSLERLNLSYNDLSREFKITKETFPYNTLQHLDLGGNKLSSLSGAKLLEALQTLNLSANSFPSEFTISGENFPVTSLENLDLSENALTSIVGIELLGKLKVVVT